MPIGLAADESVPAVLNAGELVQLQSRVNQVSVDDALVDYMLAIVEKTRQHESLALGVSPRGTLFLYHGAQAFAALHGRGYVLPDDVKYLAPFILTHRLMIGAQTRLRGRSAEQIVQEIVDSVPVPVEQ